MGYNGDLVSSIFHWCDDELKLQGLKGEIQICLHGYYLPRFTGRDTDA